MAQGQRFSLHVLKIIEKAFIRQVSIPGLCANPGEKVKIETRNKSGGRK